MLIARWRHGVSGHLARCHVVTGRGVEHVRLMSIPEQMALVALIFKLSNIAAQGSVVRRDLQELKNESRCSTLFHPLFHAAERSTLAQCVKVFRGLGSIHHNDCVVASFPFYRWPNTSAEKAVVITQSIGSIYFYEVDHFNGSGCLWQIVIVWWMAGQTGLLALLRAMRAFKGAQETLL